MYKKLFGEGNGEGGDAQSSVDPADKHFAKYYGWIYNTREVATFEGISMGEVWDLPIRQTLFDLTYLKAKTERDQRQIKQYHKR